MALEMNDIMALRGMSGNDGHMTPFEQFMVAEKQAKRPSGTAIAGLTLGTVGVAAAIGAWIFGPLYGNAKAGQAREAAIAAQALSNSQYQAALQLLNTQNQNTQSTIDRILSGFATERSERIAGDLNVTQSVTDTLSGSQQGTLTATQAAELSAVNSVMQQTYSDFVTGRASLNPTPVSLYSAPQPCACPASGCGCNG